MEEVKTYRSRRAMARAGARAPDADATRGDDPQGSSDASDGSPKQTAEEEERDPSPDDFEEIRPKAKRKRTAKRMFDSESAADLSLIEVIKSDGKQIPQAVKRWVEQYEHDPKPATVELLSMLFEACGAKYVIKEEYLDDTDVDDVVVALVNLARQGEIDDFQSSRRKEFRNFKDNLVSFWDNLVVESQNGPLFDKILFDKCMDYIIALSCTPPRIYRQVATLVGLQLVTSFISVAKLLSAQRDTTQRQLNAEKNKRTEGPRIESLNNRLFDTHDKINVLDEMMRKVFTGLFVHRYRDVDPNIRMSCIQSLGVWILSYPAVFLRDLYLKYLGWTLNDKHAGVRKASILALQSLYEVDDNVPTLSLFTERFSGRMIELGDDVDISVAVCAIGQVKHLLRHQLIADEDLGPLYDLLIDEPAEVRRAIGELVYDHLIAQKFNNSQSRSKGNESAVHLGRMLQILREFSADPILINYVIDDVWEYMKAMKDWKCIISMLLDENPLIELTDEDATNLIRLLFASVKKAVGQKIVPAPDNRKQYHTKAQKEALESNRRDITLSMMKNYPLLLRKFMADKAKISSLVEIIVYTNLEVYSLKRQEQNFKSALQLIKDAFFKHGEKDALRSCVKSIKFCSTESRGELQDYSRNKLKELEDELIAKLKSAIKEVMDGGDEYSLLVNSKRLYELHLLKPVPLDALYADLVTVLRSFRNLDDEVVGFLLLNMYLHVAWSLHSILNSETVTEASLSVLLFKRDSLFEELTYFLNASERDEDNKTGNQLARRVCTILSEAWCLFSKKAYSGTKVETLRYRPDFCIVQKFWEFCELQLKVSDETEDEDSNNEYVEELNKDAVITAAAKLIFHEAVSKESLAPEIISHFVMHGADVEEIVKHLITVLKKSGDISNIYLEALKRAYDRYLIEVSKSEDPSLADNSFQECKDLAARLSGTVGGAARAKHQADIVKIVREGTEYAFIDVPKHLSFLVAAVVHFVSKLPTPDVHAILKDVEKRTANINTDEDPSGWRPYHVFHATLKEKCAKNEPPQDEKERSCVRRRGRPRKKQNIEGKRLFEDHNSSEDEDAISTSEPEDAENQDIHDEEDEDEEEEEENTPLIESLRAAKLRSKRSREENSSLPKAGASGRR